MFACDFTNDELSRFVHCLGRNLNEPRVFPEPLSGQEVYAVLPEVACTFPFVKFKLHLWYIFNTINGQFQPSLPDRPELFEDFFQFSVRFACLGFDGVEFGHDFRDGAVGFGFACVD